MRGENINILYSVQQTERHTGEGSRDKLGLQWDTTRTDKAFYLFTPVILLKCGLILLFILRPLSREPHTTVECRWPKEFVYNWQDYAEKLCIRQSLTYVERKVSDDQDTTNSTTRPPFNPHNHPTPPPGYVQVPLSDLIRSHSDPDVIQRFSGSLLILSVIFLLPFVSWRVVGNVDGLEFLKPSNNSGFKRKTLIIWFAVTKILTSVISLVLLLTVCVLKYDSTEYISFISHRQQPTEPFVCDIWVRKRVDVKDRYTVQCLLSEGTESFRQVEDVLYMVASAMGPILSVLMVWAVGVLLTQVASLILTVYTARSCQDKSTRHCYLNRFTDWELNPQEIEQLDNKLGWIGLFVSLQSSRNGSDVSRHIKDLFDHIQQQQDNEATGEYRSAIN